MFEDMDMNKILTLMDMLDGKKDVVERSEKREQENTVRNERLPIKANGHSISAEEQYAKMGIEVIGAYDDLFFSVKLPKGWKIEATDHSMWNNLIDLNGKIRATFFFKGAFYDRDAFSNFERRYSWKDMPFDSYETNATYEERKTREHYGKVYDGDREIFSTDEKHSHNEKWFENDEIKEECLEFLNKNYPDWKSVDAYWEV